jgi:hypothetical protein
MVAARIATMRQGGDGRNQRTERAAGIRATRAEAAEKLNVSRDSIQQARKVIQRAKRLAALGHPPPAIGRPELHNMTRSIESADRAPSRKNRTRSNRLASVAA